MTKEDIVKKYGDMLCSNRVISEEVFSDINEFFDSNVCIPKGKNRHKYADVLHEWIEGAEVEYKNVIGRIDGWNRLTFQISEYRIKPSEPVYVYQYAYLEQCNEPTWDMSAYMTDEEYANSGLAHPNFTAQKCEWTKKEIR